MLLALAMPRLWVPCYSLSSTLLQTERHTCGFLVGQLGQGTKLGSSGINTGHFPRLSREARLTSKSPGVVPAQPPKGGWGEDLDRGVRRRGDG